GLLEAGLPAGDGAGGGVQHGADGGPRPVVGQQQEDVGAQPPFGAGRLAVVAQQGVAFLGAKRDTDAHGLAPAGVVSCCTDYRRGQPFSFANSPGPTLLLPRRGSCYRAENILPALFVLLSSPAVI